MDNDQDGFTAGPFYAELPIDGLEAFRLASFGIPHEPQYAPLTVDRDCDYNRMFCLMSLSLFTFTRPPEPGTYSSALSMDDQDGSVSNW